MPLYFAYGSNMDINQLRQRCPKSKFINIGKLIGYRLEFTHYSSGWEGGVADVVPDSEKEVWGIVYQLSKSDLVRLDSYEGYPDIYTRFKTGIETPFGRKSNVWVYRVVYKGTYEPTRAYLDIIKRAALTYQFPANYIAYLNRIKTI
ncbi:MAG: gamma-glutamylcyclotransferase family protein [Pseudomonadota bacterium]